MTEQQQTIKFKQKVKFSQIDNVLIESNQISGAAFKIWCYLFSRPEGWIFYWSDILKKMKEKRDKVKNATKELEDLGYISKEQKRIYTGRGKEWRWGGMDISVYYDPTENPKFNPTVENIDCSPLTENPSSGFEASGNAVTGDASTDKNLFNQYLSNQYLSSSSLLPILEEAERFAEEEDLIIDVEKWLKLSNLSKEPIRNWKVAMIAYASNPKNQLKISQKSPTVTKEEEKDRILRENQILASTEEFKPQWEKIREELKSNCDENTYNQWISKIELHSFSEDEIVFSTPSKFLRDWIRREYIEGSKQPNIREICLKYVPSLKKVSIIELTN